MFQDSDIPIILPPLSTNHDSSLSEASVNSPQGSGDTKPNPVVEQLELSSSGIRKQNRSGTFLHKQTLVIRVHCFLNLTRKTFLSNFKLNFLGKQFFTMHTYYLVGVV